MSKHFVQNGSTTIIITDWIKQPQAVKAGKLSWPRMQRKETNVVDRWPSCLRFLLNVICQSANAFFDFWLHFGRIRLAFWCVCCWKTIQNGNTNGIFILSSDIFSRILWMSTRFLNKVIYAKKWLSTLKARQCMAHEMSLLQLSFMWIF